VTTLPPATVRTRVELPLTLADGTPTTATAHTFDGLVDGREHLALSLGRWSGPPLTRLHSECLTGDVLGSRRCDCGPQLDESLLRLATEGGLLLYLRQEGRGIGLYPKLDSYLLQDAGLDTYEANRALGYREDERDYTVAAQMLAALGVHRIALLTHNDDKTTQLLRLGVDVVTVVPTGVHRSDANAHYLATKLGRAAVLPLAD
jgi:GTP cyclohydrolase II